MGWKTVKGRRYYYKSVRDGGRVGSKYYGRGEAAALIAQIEALERDERAARREALAEDLGAAEREDRAFAAWSGRVAALGRAALMAAGYHQHNRGRWRRRRMSGQAALTAADGGFTKDEVRDLISRAGRGDDAAVPRLRNFFRQGATRPSGWMRDFLDGYGRPTERLANAIVHVLASTGAKEEQKAIREATRAEFDRFRRELEGPSPTPIERLLAERAALCWFKVHCLELVMQYTSMTIPQATLNARQTASYHRQFLSALKTLAAVRKLALPALQVNIGANQMNVA